MEGVPALRAELLVGRAEELGSLEKVLDDLDRGRASAVELSGEPGIGKTRLLRELSVQAEARGHLVLAGSASELEHDLPFAVFIDALDEYVHGLDPERLEALDEPVRAELAHVFPSLWSLAGAHDVAIQHERYRSHRAIRELLGALATPAPLVLLLDDVHWADSASIELLGALLRRPPASPTLIALAMRPRQTPERLLGPLERAHRDGMLTQVPLGPLGLGDAESFLGDAMAPPEIAVIYEESGGNPFYLQQLARTAELVTTDVSAAAELSSVIDVPSAVAAALTDEIALLSEPTRSVLEGASVAGEPFDPELAAAAAAMSEAATMDAIDELLRRDLLRSTDVPRRFRFRHPLLRRAVYESTKGGWRLGAHERCATALAARGAAAPARAYHVDRSAHEGDLAAVAVLREAGDSAARLAPASAARWYGAALRLLPDTAPSEERVGLLLARAGSLAATGRFVESHADLLDCLEVVERDAEAWRIPVTTACAAVEHLLGMQTDAHRHLAGALAALGDQESSDAVGLMIELSADALHVNDLDAARTWAERSVAASTRLGEPGPLAGALTMRAWAGAFAGDGERAQAACDEATQLVDALSDEELARDLNTLAQLATADLYLDRFPAATRHAERALAIGRASGQGELLPLVIGMLGGSLWIQGRPLEAGELFDGAVEAARLVGNELNLAWNLFNRSFAAVAAGDLAVALATGEESFEICRAMEPGEISALAAAVFAYVLLENGEPQRSVDVLLTRAGGNELRLIGGGWRARFLELLTRALLAIGRQEDAERAATAARVCAESVGLPSAAAMANLATAALALGGGEPKVAAAQALEAAEALESVNALFDAARARQLAGRALAEAGEPERAASELERAAAAFDAFGALRYRDESERELRKLGRHVYRRTRPGKTDGRGIESLTERELQLARLVVDRKTNAQIAAELFISQKTVETHLRNIFNKMDVTTRVALALAVDRADREEEATEGATP